MKDDTEFEARVRAFAADATALPAPADAWARIAARVAAGEELILPAEDGPFTAEAGEPTADEVSAAAQRRAATTRRMGDWNYRRAAAIALAAGALGFAAALPASPVRSWLEELFAAAARSEAAAEVPAVAGDENAGAVDPTASTTMVIDPVGGSAVVALVQPRGGVRIRVRFADVVGLEVEATGGVAAARFRSAIGQLTVAEAADGDLLLTIPNRLARVHVLVDGRRYLTKENGHIRVYSPAADTVGSEIVLPVIR